MIFTECSTFGRGGATSYIGASPTFRLVFLWMCSKMLLSGCLTACWRGGSSSTSRYTISIECGHADQYHQEGDLREDEDSEAVELPEEWLGEISVDCSQSPAHLCQRPEGHERTIASQRTPSNPRVRLVILVTLIALVRFPCLQSVARPLGALGAVVPLHHGDGREAAAVPAHCTSSLVLCLDC